MRGYREKPVLMKYAYIVVGTGLLASAIKCVYAPNGLVVGGFSGLAIIIERLTGGLVQGGVPLWFTMSP